MKPSDTFLFGATGTGGLLPQLLISSNLQSNLLIGMNHRKDVLSSIDFVVSNAICRQHMVMCESEHVPIPLHLSHGIPKQVPEATESKS